MIMNKKYKKILLLWFDRKLLDEYTIWVNVVKPLTLNIKEVSDCIRNYWSILTQLHFVNWVFFDDIIRMIDKSLRIKDKTKLWNVDLLHSLNSYLNHNKDKILVLHKDDINNELDYLFCKIDNRIIIKNDLQLKSYLKGF